MGWFVYIIRCSDESLYTGITTDVERRFRDHEGSKRRARYFNGRKPLEVLYSEEHPDRSSASKREAVIKKLTRCDKQDLILNSPKPD
jgi:putative endonuclease